jgi:hypothetical protein
MKTGAMSAVIASVRIADDDHNLRKLIEKYLVVREVLSSKSSLMGRSVIRAKNTRGVKAPVSTYVIHECTSSFQFFDYEGNHFALCKKPDGTDTTMFCLGADPEQFINHIQAADYAR